jgi:glycolate oxidase
LRARYNLPMPEPVPTVPVLDTAAPEPADAYTPPELPALEPGEQWDAVLLTAALAEQIPPQFVLARSEDTAAYGADTSMDHARADVVVLAQSIPHVRHALHVADFYGAPVYLRGLGSGLSGGAVPARGGLVLDVSPMARLLSVNRVNRSCRVQPGLTVQQLNQQLAPHGLWYAPWPSSHDVSSIGGNIAENAGGITTVKYGTTRDWLLGLTCVLPGGDVIHTGSSAIKDVCGLDLTRLICGSEGLLCAVVEAELQLLPLPGAVGTATVLFDDDESALAAAQAVLAGPVVPRTLEYIDATVMRCVVRQLGDEARQALGEAAELISPAGRASVSVSDMADKDVSCTDGMADRDVRHIEGMAGAETRPANEYAPALLAIEADAFTAADALAQLGAVLDTLVAHGGRLLGQTTDRAEALKLWRVRSELSPACHQLGEFKLSDDVAVPRDKLVEFSRGVRAIGAKHGLHFLNYGHLGDGNFHATLMFANEDDPGIATGRAAISDLCELAVSLGGTITAEHGVGSIKAGYLAFQRTPAEIDLMRRIKHAFDPKGILNPGKWL